MSQDNNLLRRMREFGKRQKEIEERAIPYLRVSAEELDALAREGNTLVERLTAFQERWRVAEEEAASDAEKERLRQEERTLLQEVEEHLRKSNDVDERRGISPGISSLEEMGELTAAMHSLAEDIGAIGAELSIEASKLRVEVLKQQSTLSALAIAGIAAITNGPLGQAESALFLLWPAYGVLLITLVGSLLLLHAVVGHVELTLRSGGEVGSIFTTRVHYLYWVSQFGLPLGVTPFVLFLVVNL